MRKFLSTIWSTKGLARWILLGGMAALTAAQGVSAAAGVRQALGLADGDQAFSEMEARNTALRELVAQIPADARVATDYLLIARLSGRPVIYCYQSNFGTSGVDGSSGRPIPGLDDVDVVLVDASHEAWVRRLEGEAAWRLVASGGGHHLYKRAPRP